MKLPPHSPTNHMLRAENAELRARLNDAEATLRALCNGDVAETALRRNAALFSQIIQQAPGGVYVVDAQFRFQHVNAEALPVFGSVQPLIGRDFNEVMEIVWGPEIGPQCASIFRHTLATGERYISPRFSEQRHDIGVEQAFEWETQRITLPDGQHGVVCYFQDVTARERAKAALHESEQHYRALALASSEIAYRMSADWSTMLPLDGRQLVPSSDQPLAEWAWLHKNLPPDEHPRVRQAISEAIARKTHFELEHRVLRPDGSMGWTFSRAVPILDENQEVTAWFGAASDITARRQAEEALRESEERFRTLADNMVQLAWTADADGFISWYNQRWFDYTGTTIQEMQGWGWGKVHHPDHIARTTEKWRRHLAAGEIWEDTFPLRGADGKYRWFLSRAFPIRKQNGQVRRWFGTNTDVTEQRLAEEAIVQAKEKADAASRAKDDFLAALSHELRTPLTPVLMTATALREDKRLPEEVLEQLSMMERNIALEARLIDDLLDLTAISRGKLKLQVQPCDANSLIGLAIDIVRTEAEAKRIAIEREYAAKNSGLVADPARIQQVIWNILRNAVKFTPTGGRITVSTSEEIKPDGTNWLRIKITDTGIGIHPSMVDQIFLPFEQAYQTSNHRFGGLGLGLAIARAVVEMHDGRITAYSDGPGRGASFIVELPGAHAARAGVIETKTPFFVPEALKKPVPLRLLLVEDHESTRQTLTRMLSRDGHSVEAAPTVAQALAAAEAHQFDLVISDLGLPDGTGTELMEKLRAKYGLRGIALSGYGMEDDLNRSRDAGFLVHLVKPVSISELRRVLASIPSSEGN